MFNACIDQVAEAAHSHKMMITVPNGETNNTLGKDLSPISRL